MATRAEVEHAVNEFADAVRASMAAHYLNDFADQYAVDREKARQARDDARERLLALLPEPEAARPPHPLALTCPCCQGDGWVRPDWTPEPSDAEIEAAAKALWESETHLMSWESLPENTHDRWNTLRQAKAVLAAAPEQSR